MLKIHHLAMSRSDRIVWLAEELGLQYELVRHARDPKTFLATETLKAVSPVGKSPAIEDGNRVIHESAVIVEYLLDAYGKGRLRPQPGTAELDQYRYWLHCSESTLMLPVLLDMMTGMAQISSAAMDFFMTREYSTMFGYVEQTLQRHDYIAGPEFTAADIMVGYTLRLGAGTAVPGGKMRSPVEKMPGIQAYLGKLQHRAAFIRTQEILSA
ncbi:MAG: glutathione S-transferase [Hydrocarboniphaga sp.]|uniref:glutathione S-transferase family protein n=1 Tax=Hydrocarboniphaga sp. TaxID=2033016 RepID=UPI00261E0971|nr:glutathione S-transferase [Hydrocarboniphaga sp.]MDB5967852.1 glutathione S-transferase [Hydrocarboniphaga sp.]